jgi:hypothetical protein
MEWKPIIKLLLILLFSIHICYNFSEHFTTTPINWRDTSQDDVNEDSEEEEGPKVEEKYLEVAEHGYEAGKYDIQYHEPVDLIEEKNKDDFNYDYIKISNNRDDKQVKRLRAQSKILYNNPVDYKYGITPYVPSYSDTVLLTSSRNKSYNFSKIQ